MDGERVPPVPLARAPRLEVVPGAVDGEAKAALDGRPAVGRGQQGVVLHGGDLGERRVPRDALEGGVQGQSVPGVAGKADVGRERHGGKSTHRGAVASEVRGRECGRCSGGTASSAASVSSRWPCAALAGGRHLLLEGPVGVGQDDRGPGRLPPPGARDRPRRRRRPLHREPPRRLVRPAARASSSATATKRSSRGRWSRPCARGRVLFLNELNRLPEAAQNVLLPALDEGLLQVPHLGEVRAAEGFQVVADAEPGGVRRHGAPLRGGPRPLRAPRARLPDRSGGGDDRRGGDRLPTTTTLVRRGRAARAGDAAAPAPAPRAPRCAARSRPSRADAQMDDDGRGRSRGLSGLRRAARGGAHDACGAA